MKTSLLLATVTTSNKPNFIYNNQLTARLLYYKTFFTCITGTNTRTMYSSVPLPFACWKVPSWPRILPSSTSTWPTRQNGSTSPARTPSGSFATWRRLLKVRPKKVLYSLSFSEQDHKATRLLPEYLRAFLPTFFVCYLIFFFLFGNWPAHTASSVTCLIRLL